jgi:hypothetical protein
MRRSAKNIVECYVVRIYRRDCKDSSLVDGVVEGTGGEAVKVFHNAGELLAALDLPTHGEPAAEEKRGLAEKGPKDERLEMFPAFDRPLSEWHNNKGRLSD